MSFYLDVIISYNEMIPYMEDLLQKYNIHIYISKLNNDDLVYFEEVQIDEFNIAMIKDEGYKKLFLSSKKVKFQKGLSFYDSNLGKYTIEVLGGRENEHELEIIRFRILSKTPEKNIRLFYTNLQKKIKDDKNFGIGVKSGLHFYEKVFYLKKPRYKTIWWDLSKKNFPGSAPLEPK